MLSINRSAFHCSFLFPQMYLLTDNHAQMLKSQHQHLPLYRNAGWSFCLNKCLKKLKCIRIRLSSTTDVTVTLYDVAVLMFMLDVQMQIA